MAIQPPPAPPGAAVPQQAAPPATKKRSGCFGCGCGGCLLIVVVIALLVGGGGYWFFVVQASAAVTAPATLILFNQPVTVNSNPGTPGEQLNANDTVATQDGGHASIQFPDGSYIRMAPQTQVQITSVQLQKNGNVQAIEALQKTGRTLVNVQHLASGATFKVNGHSVSATVRGTQFEMLVRPNGTILIKVFDGTVRVSGKTTVDVTAGNEVEIDANGNLSAVRPIRRDPQDPYPMAAQCSRSVSGGTTAGTAQTTTGDGISTGQTAEVDYDSPGGTVSVALCYPGSSMTLSVTDPNGVEHPLRGGNSSVSGPAGRYRAIVHAVDVNPAEAFAVAFATNSPCQAGNVDSGNAVRYTLSNSQIATALAESGTSDVTIYVAGTSPTAARIVYYSNVGGTPISWTIDFYAATPHLGAVITQVTVRSINVTTAVVTNLSSFGGHSISSIPSGFIVDRVYSCASPTGDNMMVVEGHH
jgi:hypothetical protein